MCQNLLTKSGRLRGKCMPGNESRLGPALEALVCHCTLELIGVQLAVPVEVHEAEDALAHDLRLADAAQQLPVPDTVHGSNNMYSEQP